MLTVDVSLFSYVSYRLACTEQLYDTFINSSFWPSHVMIGDFVGIPRKETSVALFATPPSFFEIPAPNPNVERNNQNEQSNMDVVEETIVNKH